MTAPVQPEPEPTPKPIVAPPPEPVSPQTPTALGRAPEPLADAEPHSVATLVEPHAALEPAAVVARPVSPPERETVFVPMSVTIGDGFKFGCGFFLALVLAMLIGFVLLAALFVLTSLFGLNLPITR
jgi:hypothetical protein